MFSPLALQLGPSAGGENPLDCERTRFASAFRTDQSVGDAVAEELGKIAGLSIDELKKQRADRFYAIGRSGVIVIDPARQRVIYLYNG